jgi:hypothetical protein
MATISSRVVQLTFSGDFNQPSVNYAALDNTASPGQTDLVNLILGDNTVVVPPGTTPTALNIIWPSGNAVQVTLKGISGDSGIPLHISDPVSLTLGTGFSSLILSAAAAITGVRLIWT